MISAVRAPRWRETSLSSLRSQSHFRARWNRASQVRRATKSPDIDREVANEKRQAFLQVDGDEEPSASLANAQKAMTPMLGSLDEAKFCLHWTIEYWKTLDVALDSTISNEQNFLRVYLQTWSEAVGKSSGIFDSPAAVAYWTYHFTRTSYMGMQGITAFLWGHAVAAAQGRPMPQGTVGPFSISPSMYAVHGTGESLLTYLQDWRNIQAGLYKLPWDMVTPSHRQYSPAYVLGGALGHVQEVAEVLRRIHAGREDPLWLSSPLYPAYYMHSFHYQTDGWFSDLSAARYELGTEVTLAGGQDAMKRQGLVPLAQFFAARGAAEGRGMSLLEVGCGTGRQLTFIKDNWHELDVTALDLSPYYLAAARESLRRWKSARAAGQQLGGPDGTGVRYMQAAAEAMPLDNGSFDVVTSVYLFHELPAPIRVQVAREMARVLKPGGLLVLTDSYQQGDRSNRRGSGRNKALSEFGRAFNEPHHGGYADQEDLGALFEGVGLLCDMKMMASAVKILTFRKPE